MTSQPPLDYPVVTGASYGASYGTTGGGGFSPADIPDLFFWIDATDSSTVTTVGSKVGAIADKSGNNRGLTQGTDANRPTYTANGIGVYNTMTFDRTAFTYMTFDNSISYDGAFTVFSVVKPNSLDMVSANSYGMPLIKHFTGTGSIGDYMVNVRGGTGGATTGTSVVMRWDTAGNDGNGRFETSTTTYMDGVTSLVTSIYTGSSSAVFRYQGDVQSQVAAAATASGWGAEDVMGRIFTTADQRWYLDAEVAEVIMYNRQLFTEEIEQMEIFLSQKYGLYYSAFTYDSLDIAQRIDVKRNKMNLEELSTPYPDYRGDLRYSFDANFRGSLTLSDDDELLSFTNAIPSEAVTGTLNEEAGTVKPFRALNEDINKYYIDFGTDNNVRMNYLFGDVLDSIFAGASAAYTIVGIGRPQGTNYTGFNSTDTFAAKRNENGSQAGYQSGWIGLTDFDQRYAYGLTEDGTRSNTVLVRSDENLHDTLNCSIISIDVTGATATDKVKVYRAQSGSSTLPSQVVVSTLGNGVGINNSAQFSMGADEHGVNGWIHSLRGQYYKLFIFDAVLTSDERDEIAAWVLDNYGF